MQERNGMLLIRERNKILKKCIVMNLIHASTQKRALREITWDIKESNSMNFSIMSNINLVMKQMLTNWKPLRLRNQPSLSNNNMGKHKCRARIFTLYLSKLR